jgi:iron complex outermembrane recepter protein
MIKVSRRSERTLMAALLAGTVLCAPGIAQAQAPEAAEEDVIIVTAQKRSQSLQDVPISIQALGTQTLEERGVANFTDFTKQLPSVSFQTSSPGSTNVYIRGVASGGDGNHSGSLPSVGVYLDEQPITTIGGTLDVHIYDIARIEALSGPQGTLYGASSEAGTLRIITNQPKIGDTSGAVDAELNTVNKGGIGGKLEGYVNLPLGDSAALRIVGFYKHDAGYIDNVRGTRAFLGAPITNAGGFRTGNLPGISINNAARVKDDYNDVDTYGGRAALRVELDDNWTATAQVIGQIQESNGSFGSDPRVGDLAVQRFLPESKDDKWIQGALTIEGKIGNWDLTYTGAYLKRSIDSMSDYTDYAEAYDQLYANYTDPDTGQLVCSGLAGCFYYNDNAGNLIPPIQGIKGTDRYKKLSQELRFGSPQGERFRVVGGLFYQRQEHNIRQDYYVTGLAPLLSVNGYPGTLWLTQQVRVDKDYAAFGEASFDLLENLTLTGGLRYYKYDNSLVGFFGFGRNPGNGFSDGPPNGAGSNRTGVAQCYTTSFQRLYDRDSRTYATSRTLLPPVVDGSPCTNLGDIVNGQVVPRRTKDDGFIHRLNATWKINPDAMIYATWSRGFRPGGINRRSTIPPYDADFLSNYELGWKTSWADDKLRWNGALFLADWSKFQYSFLGENSFTQIENGPNARIRGVETDVTFSPTRDLTLSATAAYLDAKTEENLCSAVDLADTAKLCNGAGNSVLAPAGTKLPVTPEFKINASARYEFPLGAADGHIQGVVTHQTSATSDLRVNLNPALGPLPNLDGYTVFDFAAGAKWESLSAELFVTNLFDKRAEISTGVQCGTCYQRPYYYYLPPRTIGLRVGTKF